MRLLREILYRLGAFEIKRRERRVDVEPRVGEWLYDESIRDYTWVEIKQLKNLYDISVLENEDEYILCVDKEPKEGAIDTYHCQDLREVQIALELYRKGYETQGKKIRVEGHVPIESGKKR